MKATTQIIDLRSLIATTESDDEEEGWSQKSSSWQKCITECKEALEKPQQKKSKPCLPSVDGRSVKEDDDIGAGAGAGPLKGPFASAEEIMSTKTAPSIKQSADHIEKQRLWSAQHTGIQRKGSRVFETGAGAGAVGHREKGLLTDMDICIAIFEKNLSGLRARLVKGMKVLLWEEGTGCHVHSFECIMTLDRAFEVLSFTGTSAARRSTFSIFSQRIEVDPIRYVTCLHCTVLYCLQQYSITLQAQSMHSTLLPVFTLCCRIEDIADILSNTIMTQEQHLGLLSVFKGGEKHPIDALTLTINPHTVAVPSLKRMVLLKAPQREDRNFLLSALRTLISVSQNRRAEDMSPASTKHGAVKAATLPFSLPAVPGKDRALIDPHTCLEVDHILHLSFIPSSFSSLSFTLPPLYFALSCRVCKLTLNVFLKRI